MQDVLLQTMLVYPKSLPPLVMPHNHAFPISLELTYATNTFAVKHRTFRQSLFLFVEQYILFKLLRVSLKYVEGGITSITEFIHSRINYILSLNWHERENDISTPLKCGL